MRAKAFSRVDRFACKKFSQNVKFLIHCITFGAIMLALELLWFKKALKSNAPDSPNCGFAN